MVFTWNNRQLCDRVSEDHVGQPITLAGWVDTTRDHGQLLFIHLRDRSGHMQVVCDREKNQGIYNQAKSLRSEFVIAVTGHIQMRSPNTINRDMPSGTIEMIADHIDLLNKSKTPPFMVSEKAIDKRNMDVDEDIRLTYRYLDLRRESMQKNIVARSQIIRAMRQVLDDWEFLDIETPTLTKSTTEGARDYLVPSRTQKNGFFALPQSPQLFKQLLMVSGFERYYQVVKCFRDEDLRPNRQPEFTQLDIEASFVNEADIISLTNQIITAAFKSQGITIQHPIPSITYDHAINTYGTDAPDLRYGLPLIDVTAALTDSNYNIFNTIIQSGGIIKGLVLPGMAESLSKNMLQNDLAKSLIQSCGGKGLTWMKVLENHAFESNIVQFFTNDQLIEARNTMKAQPGDIMMLVADTDPSQVNRVLGRLRIALAERFNLIPTDVFSACWITDFPLFDVTDTGLTSLHHPFTQPNAPLREDMSPSDALAVTARAYDIVINGQEIGGGSVRIHDPSEQHAVFKLLGLTDDEIQSKFGFFVEALTYGAPPHAGLAIGIDRLVSIILNTNSIRDVIAFPKNRVAYCPLTHAPGPVDEAQLIDLNLMHRPDLSSPSDQ